MKCIRKILGVVAVALFIGMTACQAEPEPQQSTSASTELVAVTIDWSTVKHYRAECRPFVEDCKEGHLMTDEMLKNLEHTNYY